MQIGVVPVLNAHSGSIYSYSYNLLTALYHLESDDGFILFAEDAAPLGFLGDARKRWRIRPLQPHSMRRLLGKYLRRLARRTPHQTVWDAIPFRPAVDEFDEGEPEVFDPDVINYQPERGRWFARNGADMMLYPAPSTLSFEAGIPFIVALHDLRFGLHSSYPRLLKEGEANAYEYMIRNAARYSAMILADSEAGKEDILKYCSGYGVTEDHVRVLPPVPAAYLDAGISEDEVQDVLKRYGIQEPYLLVPASFWPQKNHDRIVEALAFLKEEYKLAVHAVFCGSSAGAIRSLRRQEIVDLVHDREMESFVRFPGYVPELEMSALYAGARLVVDLKLFGTYSVVAREAWDFGRAVLASRIRGIREQVGDAAWTVDPKSVEEIAEGIRKLWTEPDTRARLAERGTEKRNAFSFPAFSAQLAGLLRDAERRMESREES